MTIEIIEDVPYIFIEKLHEDKVLCLNINGELIKTFKLAKLTSFTICSYDGTMYYYIYNRILGSENGDIQCYDILSGDVIHEYKEVKGINVLYYNEFISKNKVFVAFDDCTAYNIYI